MTLSLRQQYEVLKAVEFVHANMNNVVQALDRLADVRNAYGPDVETYLADVVTPAEWQDTRAWAVARRDLLRQRAETRLGDGLDSLEQGA